MRLPMAILLAVVVTTGSAAAGALTAFDADAATMSEYQPAQREQPSPTGDASQTGAQAESGNASAAWGSAIWIVLVLVAAVAFVGLAMLGLRGSQNRTRT